MKVFKFLLQFQVYSPLLLQNNMGHSLSHKSALLDARYAFLHFDCLNLENRAFSKLKNIYFINTEFAIRQHASKKTDKNQMTYSFDSFPIIL